MAQQPRVGGARATTPRPSQRARPAPPARPAQPAAVIAAPVAPAALVAGSAQPAAVIAVLVEPAAPVAAPIPAVRQVVAPVAGPFILNLAGVVVGVQARDDIQAGLMGPQATKIDIRFTIWP